MIISILLCSVLSIGTQRLDVARSQPSEFPFAINRIEAHFKDFLWTRHRESGGTREHPVTRWTNVQTGYIFSVIFEIRLRRPTPFVDSLLTVHGWLPNNQPFATLVYSDDLEETGTDLYTFVLDVRAKSTGWATFLLAPANAPFQINEYEYPQRSNKSSVQFWYVDAEGNER